MNRFIAIFALSLVGVGCGGEPPTETGEATAEVKACPYLVPLCPDGCKLEGHCPKTCHCPEGWTACGNSYCDPKQTCCVGMPFIEPTCWGGNICPISRREYKTDIDYLDAGARERLAGELLKFRLATYQYKPGVADGERHLGFIIDDVGQSPAVAPSGERVDLYGYTSMAVAALQTQAQQIARLEHEVASLRSQLARHHR
jgi:hypothetical protein